MSNPPPGACERQLREHSASGQRVLRYSAALATGAHGIIVAFRSFQEEQLQQIRIGRWMQVVAFSAGLLSAMALRAQTLSRPLIFPAPREMAVSAGSFPIDSSVTIAVPVYASSEDLLLARLLTEEMSDRFGVSLETERVAAVPGGRTVLIGSISNPLVRAYSAEAGMSVSAADPGREGYILKVTPQLVLVAGSDDQGAFYGLQSLRQLAAKDAAGLRFRGVTVRDWPDKPFRAIKLYLPGHRDIPFFKRFVRDFMALYKYNTLVVEMNASMRLDRHPELNAGWQDFARETEYYRRNYPPGALHDVEQNSTHQDIADGDILEKDEVADLAQWVKRYHIELIPELPAFTHSYYLLSRHKDLAEVPGNRWPDTYCPANSQSYQLLFDVYDEYIEVLKPRMIHAGHDELFMPVGLCPRCKDKDIGERYGEDVRRIHDYLASKGIQMAIWGDMLLEEVRGKGLQPKTAPDGWKYHVAGGMTPEQVNRLIPKDILIFNWFWNPEPGLWDERQAEHNEVRLEELGFHEVLGNFTPEIQNYDTRRKRASIIGGAPSAWFATAEFGFGKDLMSDFLGCINMLWNGNNIPAPELSETVQAMMPDVRERLRGQLPPSVTESSIEPLDISPAFNFASVARALNVDLSSVRPGSVTLGHVRFDLQSAGGKDTVVVAAEGVGETGVPAGAPPIKIGRDATSLLFLHAAARPAANHEMYRLQWDPEDTADLLGWYEVTYEDGFTITVPIRYGVNIQEWNWSKRRTARDYCYGADAVLLGSQSNPVTLFAFEWKNPRLGKVIREVRLKGVSNFRGASTNFDNEYGPVTPSNAVLLKAITVVGKRQ